jgi:uncharacterized membrane protein
VEDPIGAKSQSVADKNIRAVARFELESRHHRSRLERASDAITSFASHESAVALHALLFAAWIAINSGAVGITPFDPFPFSLLTMLVSLEAIFLTLFVLASQQRLTEFADRRASLDLQVNLLAEREMTLVLCMLKEICDRLDIHETTRTAEFSELMKRTDIQELAEHVARSSDESGKPRVA